MMTFTNRSFSSSCSIFMISGAVLAVACSGPDDTEPQPVESDTSPGGQPGADEGVWGQEQGEGPWKKVELEGAVCADGSPYKFFIKRNDASRDLTVTFEPGGACWSYDSCTGAGGVQRVANIDGLRDDHMTALPPPLGSVEGAVPWGLMFPHLGESDTGTSTAEFNHVFLPYCTGDAFLGDTSRSYESEAGDVVEIEHRGASNLQLVKEWLAESFVGVERLLVTGSSAGGLGATMHYAPLREALAPGQAALINDSGPLFPSGSHQDAARATFAERWGSAAFLTELDALLGSDPGAAGVSEDSSNISSLLANAYPGDRLAITFFQRDLNYSLFSYLGFFDELSVDEIYAMWDEDTSLLVSELEKHDGWDYYLPAFRPDGCSHTVSLVPADELTSLSFASEALAGNADGYLRTDLGDLSFEDLLDNAFDADSSLLRARANDPNYDFSESALAACLEWPE